MILFLILLIRSLGLDLKAVAKLAADIDKYHWVFIYNFILNLALRALKFLNSMLIFAYLHQAFSVARLYSYVLINPILMSLALLLVLGGTMDPPLVVELA